MFRNMGDGNKGGGAFGDGFHLAESEDAYCPIRGFFFGCGYLFGKGDEGYGLSCGKSDAGRTLAHAWAFEGDFMRAGFETDPPGDVAQNVAIRIHRFAVDEKPQFVLALRHGMDEAGEGGDIGRSSWRCGGR